MAEGKAKVVVGGPPKKGEGSMNQERILAQFEKMRQEQRAIASKIAELEGDMNEHRLVVDTLRKTAGGRRCFRMVGGVLVERTVKEVLPALQHNTEQISVMVQKLTEQLSSKGKELNEFRAKHNIRFREEKAREGESEEESGPKSSGVLVS